jgi:hypothetical protein
MTKSGADAILSDDMALDDQILRLRESGRSYLAIAERLGLERATVARSRYLRALARLSPEEQSASRLGELQRLDSLANHIAARDDLDGPEIARRLRLVDLLRFDLPEQ